MPNFSPEPTNPYRFLTGGGEMGSLIRSIDWGRTALGPVEGWPQSLLTSVSLCLSSTFPILIAWGPEHVQIYNDAYRPICGAKHPAAMGQRFKDCWATALPVVGEIFDRAWAGEGSYIENQRMLLDRYGYLEEAFMTFSFSPIRDESGQVGGLFHPITENTDRMLAARRAQILRDFSVSAAAAADLSELAIRAGAVLSASRSDLPFFAVYALQAGGAKLTKIMGAGMAEGHAPGEIDLNQVKSLWPFAEVLADGKPRVVGIERFALEGLDTFAEELPKEAVVAPITTAASEQTFGILIAGVNPLRALDETYLSFYDFLVKGFESAVGKILSYEVSQKRAAALAEIDRSKTAFFSNVSHEFRTPLTLMLGPLEENLAEPPGLVPAVFRAREEIAYRNALRLLRLVNTLLEFSRIEAGRRRARFQPTDLAKLTADLASVFRAAIEKAGLVFHVQLEDLGEPAYVDREMWERIILNLLSNALKFTFQGQITVSLRRAGAAAILTVGDTGTGISAKELPRIFERFHRVEGAAGRSHEGTGIGLALIKELVEMHGGIISAESALEEGSNFSVEIPLGRAHLPPDQLGPEEEARGPSSLGAAFADEALRWLPEAAEPLTVIEDTPEKISNGAARKYILVADDNADLRAYIENLLCAEYEVKAVADGAAAFAAACARRPDLLLSDVMMPIMDGFELLKNIQQDPRTCGIPVVLLSARAGEDSRIEGLESGADDYLVKPFSAKELLARVRTHLQISSLRRNAEDALASRDEFLSIASHELKTPVTSLKLQLQLAQRRLKAGDAAALSLAGTMITRALKQVDRLTVLLEDLLDIARIRAGKISFHFEEVNVAALLSDVAERFADSLSSAGNLLRLSSEPNMMARWDRSRIDQVLANLISNAIKYAPGAPIEISARALPEMIQITVRDNGPGIEPNRRNAIFERFERATTSRNISGLGLGLFIVRKIVESHGGTIVLGDSPGGGTAFVIRLPKIALANSEI